VILPRSPGQSRIPSQVKVAHGHPGGGPFDHLRVVASTCVNRVSPTPCALERSRQQGSSRKCQCSSSMKPTNCTFSYAFPGIPLIYTFSPGLIQSVEAMKALLDSMLVLTKQDRLCHVIHATSDPFYQTWLRQLNVMQHCKVRTVL